MDALDPNADYTTGSDNIKELQRALNAAGFSDLRFLPLGVNGVYGDRVKEAVGFLQGQFGQRSTGILTAQDIENLNLAIAPHQTVEHTPGSQERILMAAVAGFDVGTGSRHNIDPSKVANPDAQYEYKQAGRGGRDTDGDGFKETDCSATVYQSLLNSGYRVDLTFPNVSNEQNVGGRNFSTWSIFSGSSSARTLNLTSYAQERFDTIDEKDAQVGDIIMFRSPNASGQPHIGIVTNVQDGKVVNYYGSQGSTGPAVADNNRTTFLGVIRPKPEFYDPSRDLTRELPQDFYDRYTDIVRGVIKPDEHAGKPSYPLLENANSWEGIETVPRITMSPEVRAIDDKLNGGMRQQLHDLGVNPRAVNSMMSTLTLSCARQGISADDIGTMHINTGQNKLLVVSACNDKLFTSVDAISASRQDSAQQYDQAITAQQEQQRQQQNPPQQQPEQVLMPAGLSR